MAADALAEVRREEFPGTEGAVFFNAGSFGPLPRRSLRALDAFHGSRAEPHRLDPGSFGPILARAREAAAALIGAGPDEISLGANTTFGLNFAAEAMRRRPTGRRTIVVSEGEFPANMYPWLWLERDGFRVERVPTRGDGCPDEPRMLERLERGDVALLALSLVQFATGHRADLARFGEVCRRHDIRFVIDGIQGIGAVPFDAREVGADIVACGAQKWLCSPFGTGFMYVRRELRDSLEPPIPGWLSFAATQDFTTLLDYDLELLPDGRRFEVATLPIQDYAACAESLALFAEIGAAAIWERIRAVQEPLIRWVESAPGCGRIGGREEHQRSGILAVSAPDAERLHARLAEAGVICVVREGALRFSPHFYNTVEEAERVVEILERNLRA